mmetsp:Transcript_38286/g.56235  ORF Transcript_38286/g.56235 Transcript_38286/m.56235 type:complete len:84 (-) Transcript_38286:225-476(-)
MVLLLQLSAGGGGGGDEGEASPSGSKNDSTLFRRGPCKNEKTDAPNESTDSRVTATTQYCSAFNGLERSRGAFSHPLVYMRFR